MDERYLLAAARYVELNPVHARMVERPQDYPWSSARAHLDGRDDALVKVAPLLNLVGRWSARSPDRAPSGAPSTDLASLQRCIGTGRRRWANWFSYFLFLNDTQ